MATASSRAERTVCLDLAVWLWSVWEGFEDGGLLPEVAHAEVNLAVSMDCIPELIAFQHAAVSLAFKMILLLQSSDAA